MALGGTWLTRNGLLKLVAQEAASRQALHDASFDYNLLTSVVPGVDRNVEADSDSEDDEEAAQAALTHRESAHYVCTPIYIRSDL